MLGWTPATFWQSTVIEFEAAFDAWAERNGVKQAAPFLKADLEELEKEVKRRRGEG